MRYSHYAARPPCGAGPCSPRAHPWDTMAATGSQVCRSRDTAKGEVTTIKTTRSELKHE